MERRTVDFFINQSSLNCNSLSGLQNADSNLIIRKVCDGWEGCPLTLPLLLLTSLILKALVKYIFVVLTPLFWANAWQETFQIITVAPKEMLTNPLWVCKMFHQK